ncbi:MAG TPA: L-threonylcarbamoyladenylate synthase [Candidatus Hydrogenedens sp.]|nr:L-threonylcarbamoyladenylate synthase [Candidatus Hydrogenedens sp.]
MKIVLPDEEGFQQAVDALKNDEIVAYPTETVYGLAVNPFSEAAIEKLFKVKGRPEDKPVLLVIGKLTQIKELVTSISDIDITCMLNFWPGPLSLLLPSNCKLSPKLTDKEGKVCVRWSSHSIAQKLSLEFGHAITSTSANRTGEKPATSVSELSIESISIAIEGESSMSSELSTIFETETGKIIREGVIKREELERTLRMKIR